MPQPPSMKEVASWVVSSSWLTPRTTRPAARRDRRVFRSRTRIGGVKAIALSTGPSDQDLVLLMRRRHARRLRRGVPPVPRAHLAVPAAADRAPGAGRGPVPGHLAGGGPQRPPPARGQSAAALAVHHRPQQAPQRACASPPWSSVAGNRSKPSRDAARPAAPEVDVDARADAARVAAAFPRLTEAHREVLLLCLVEGLDSETAARVLGLRPEAVRKRLSRARAELARLAGFPTG